MNLQGHRNDGSGSRPGSAIGVSAGVWLSCQAIIWISVLAGLLRVFANQVTNLIGPDKTGLIALFCISRNTNFNIECTVLLCWLDTVTPDILYNKCI